MLTCLIIEDEPLAADVLQDYILQIPYLDLRAICSDAIFALEVLQKEKIDLIFLDIHLPGLKGLEFLKSLINPPAVILTTAYHEYALQSYELNVVDYLLKPIAFERFVTAVNKVKNLAISHSPNRDTITIQSDKKRVIVTLSEIMYIESQKEYLKIQTSTEAFITKYGLSKIESELDAHRFMRIHRSFIVSLSKIKAFNAHEIDIGGKTLPIGANYKKSVEEKLNSLF